MDQREVDSFREIEKRDPLSTDKSATTSGREDYEARKKRKSLQNKISKVEKQITALEKDIADMDHSLLMDYDAVSAEPKFFDDYHNKKKE